MTTRSFTEFIEVNPKVAFEKDKEYPFVEMSNVGILQREPEKVEIKGYGSGTKFQRGDTVVARIEPCLQNGKGFFVKNFDEGFGSTEFLVFRSKDETKLDNIYLYYLMQDKYIRECMIRSMTGATGRQRVNNKVFDNIKVNIPKLDIQKKIAYILKSYDDLIENNVKRIKLLEDTAQLIYKEWFVNFRFPGYEKCEFVDGLPEKWKTIKVKEFGDVITGKTPSTKKVEYYGDEIPFIKTPDMSNGIYVVETNQSLSEAGAKSQEKKFIPKDAILVSCIGTLGVVALAKELSQFNQQINAVVCNKKEYIHYLYFKFKSLKEYLEALGSNGATMGNVNKNKFENIDILKPNDTLLEEYYNFSEPIFKEILNLQLSNQKLKEARDILIPKLITGEIEI
ncbi:restriction endonuclease subunit S [Clostridium butyricum]|uniref:restriction endonuclease subunit S n=1 Tax=Clostridium butyricum TaxID=1492 RepID=UPI003D0F2FF2